MAIGQVVSIASGQHNQQYVPSGAAYPAVAILNPNDGVVYVSQNQDCIGTGTGQWDYKIPSQSYASIPGPWQSVGMFYVDQSGSGAAGQITIYPIPGTVTYPEFHAIGRAVQAIGSTLDITEGTQPSPPGAGLLRLWADGTDSLHLLGGSNVDHLVLDTLNYGSHITALAGNLNVGGILSAGPYPGGALGGDLVVNRGGASPGSAAIFFGNSGSHYIFWDSVQFQLAGSLVVSGSINAGAIAGSTINASSTIVAAGTIQSTGGAVGAGTNVAAAVGDLWSNRGSAAGYCWLGNTASHYIGFDGTNYQLPTSPLNAVALLVPASASALSFSSAANSGGAPIAFNQAVGPKISFYDNGGGSFYGMGINGSELFLCFTGAIRFRNTNGSGGIVHTFDGSGNYTNTGNLSTPGSLTFNAAFQGGSVIASGGTHTADWLVVVNGTVYRIQLWQ